MLDKSIPYKNITMCLPKEKMAALHRPMLASGAVCRTYRAGDEYEWARLEAAVGEFDGRDEALAFFRQHYLIKSDELSRRCFFVETADGTIVATAMTCEKDSLHGLRTCLNWVSTDPAAQGCGYGKAVVLYALTEGAKIDPARDIYLHTQTWSHVAVAMYARLGFCLSKTEVLRRERDCTKFYQNDYGEAIEILKTVLDAKTVTMLEKSAVP